MKLNNRLYFRALGILPLLAALAVFAHGAPRGLPAATDVDVTFDVPAAAREFAFEIGAGETVAVECDKREADTLLVVRGDGGEELARSVSPLGHAGRDRLFFVADKSGRVTLAASPRTPGANSGGCVLRREPARIADAADRLASGAYRELGEALRGLNSSGPRVAAAMRALAAAGRAETDFDAAGDRRGRALALFWQAYVAGEELGREADSIALYERAAAAFDEVGDAAGRAATILQMAEEARDHDAVEGGRAAAVKRARVLFAEALAFYRGLGSKFGEATTLAYLCRVDNDANQFQAGLDGCRAALRIVEGRDPFVEYRVYSNLASLAANSGDRETAMKLNRTSLEKLAVVREYVNPAREAFVRTNVAGLYLSARDYARAEATYREALATTEAAERPLQTAYILVRLAQTLRESGRLADAVAPAERAVELYRLHDPLRNQAALNGLGKIRAALGDEDAARRLFDEAVAVNRLNGDRYAEAESLYNLAASELRAGLSDGALEHARLAIVNSESNRAQLYGRRQRTSYLAILKRYYELESDILLRLADARGDAGLLEQAWQRSERIRARALLETLAEAGINLAEIAPDGYLEREQKLLDIVAAAESRRAAVERSGDSSSTGAAETALRKALDDYEELHESIRRTNPRFSAISRPTDLTAAEARAMLDENTVALEYSLGEARSGVWIFRRDGFRFAGLAPRAEIDRAARAYLDAIVASPADEKAVAARGAELAKLVLGPVSADLGRAERLVVIADGGLENVPFATLAPAPGAAPLAATMEVTGAPSFATLAFLRESRPRRAPAPEKQLAVFADPVFRADDERLGRRPAANPAPDAVNRDFNAGALGRLPFSGIEAREIVRYAPKASFLALGTEASRRTFLDGGFGSFRILHFATHGYLNPENPELSGLVLSLFDDRGRPQNGFLRGLDLYNMRLESELVVLSACQTGLGREVNGEGVVGLSRAFMYAGAASVVSSLWKVDDAASAEFMKRFYRALLAERKTPSAALRTAQNELRGIPRFAAPKFWAGFTLNGDWR